jgi:pyridoxamine 5'-phosphate oxidase
MQREDSLPEPLPSSPFGLFLAWFDEARQRQAQPNPDAMVLATADAEGRPSARIVLCKRIVAEPGYVVFFTNFESRKGRELSRCPRAAAVFHWDALHRQVRIEGPVVRSPDAESDEYFASRALDSRIGAWASRQSEPLASRAALAAQVRAVETRFGVTAGDKTRPVPRPPHWGGYRIWIENIELWMEGANRIHDRAMWSRDLRRARDDSFSASEWRSTRLNP